MAWDICWEISGTNNCDKELAKACCCSCVIVWLLTVATPEDWSLLLGHLSRWCFGGCLTHSAPSSIVLFSVRGWCYSHPGLANCLCRLLVHLKNKNKSVAEFPCQHSHTIFRKDVWRPINWFALFRVTRYDFQEVKLILVSLSDMQQKRDNSNENTCKLNETFSHLNNPIYSISNKFTYLQFILTMTVSFIWVGVPRALFVCQLRFIINFFTIV